MKVIVTGGCGFVGSHVCEYYRRNGAQVIAYDNQTKFELSRSGYSPDSARMYMIDFLTSIGVKIVRSDIRDPVSLEKCIRGSDYIIHTAAQPAITISCEDPSLDFSTNAIGTFNVLELARKYRIPMVSCATIHVYGNKINDDVLEGNSRFFRDPALINETYPLGTGNITPLHVSKITGDLLVNAYIHTYNLQLASFRLTGLYGPRQFGGEDHGWVANFAIRAVMGRPITLFGNGKQVRDILYVSDLVRAFEQFYIYRKPGVYNIGGGLKTSISLLECVELIQRIVRKKLLVKHLPLRTGDLTYFACDTKRAKTFLKWRPQVVPKAGISELLNWIESNKPLFK